MTWLNNIGFAYKGIVKKKSYCSVNLNIGFQGWIIFKIGWCAIEGRRICCWPKRLQLSTSHRDLSQTKSVILHELILSWTRHKSSTFLIWRVCIFYKNFWTSKLSKEQAYCQIIWLQNLVSSNAEDLLILQLSQTKSHDACMLLSHVKFVG